MLAPLLFASPGGEKNGEVSGAVVLWCMSNQKGSRYVEVMLVFILLLDLRDQLYNAHFYEREGVYVFVHMHLYEYLIVDTGPIGYPARERKDLVQLGFFPCNLSSRTIK